MKRAEDLRLNDKVLILDSSRIILECTVARIEKDAGHLILFISRDGRQFLVWTCEPKQSLVRMYDSIIIIDLEFKWFSRFMRPELQNLISDK